MSKKRLASSLLNHVQGSTKRRAPGLANFILALAYHFCLALHAAFTQPGDSPIRQAPYTTVPDTGFRNLFEQNYVCPFAGEAAQVRDLPEVVPDAGRPQVPHVRPQRLVAAQVS